MLRVKKPGRPLSTCPHPKHSCSCGRERVLMVRIPKGTISYISIPSHKRWLTICSLKLSMCTSLQRWTKRTTIRSTNSRPTRIFPNLLFIIQVQTPRQLSRSKAWPATAWHRRSRWQRLYQSQWSEATIRWSHSHPNTWVIGRAACSKR